MSYKLKDENKAFNIFLLLIPLVPYYKIMPEVINSAIFILISLLCFMRFKSLYSSNLANEKRKITEFLKGETCLGLCFFISLISIFLSEDKVISLMNWPTIPIMLVVYFIAINSKKFDFQEALKYIFYGGVFSTIPSLWIYILEGEQRLNGIFNYANTTALFYGICTLIYFYLTLEKRPIEEGVKERVGAILVLTSLLLTQSRGGILIYFLGLTLSLLFLGNNNNKFAINIICTNLISIIFSYALISSQYFIVILLIPFVYFYHILYKEVKVKKVKSFGLVYLAILGAIVSLVLLTFKRLGELTLKNPQLQERMVFYEDAVKVIKYNLLGIGPGRWSNEQFFYSSANYDVKYIHNSFLQILVDYGIPFFLFLIGTAAFVLIKAVKNKTYKNIYFILALMIIIHSLFDFNMSYIYINIILALCLSKLRVLTSVSSCNCVSKNIRIRNIGGFLRKAMIITTLVISITMLGLLPGELIYNLAIVKITNNNVVGAHSLLKKYEAFPYKTLRYYDKLANIEYSLFSLDRDKDHLEKGILATNTLLSRDENDPRANELLGSIYFIKGDYDKAAECFEKVVKIKKYYMPTYDKLIEAYYLLHKDGTISSQQYVKNIRTVEENIGALKSSINLRAKYMNNQPSGKLNNFQLLRIVQGYGFINDYDNYKRYLDMLDKDSKEYKEIKDMIF